MPIPPRMPCSLLPVPKLRFVESQNRLTACLVVYGFQCKAWATPDAELQVTCAMLDIIMLALVIVCFALAAAYATLCERLLAPSAGKDASP